MHALQQLMNLAAKLTCADEDGRLIIDTGQGVVKFVLLNAAARFCQVCHGPVIAAASDNAAAGCLMKYVQYAVSPG